MTALASGLLAAALADVVPASAANLTILNGQTFTVAGGGQTVDALNINAGGVLDLGSQTLTAVDNVNTTWAGTVHGVSDAGALNKTGTGTVTLSNFVMDGGELHLSNGAMQQSSGASRIWYLAVGTGTGGTGTMTMSGGTLAINDQDSLWTSIPKSPTLQVGDFGGTGIFNQTGGTVILTDAGLNIGNQGGNGTYNLSGGTLSLTGALYSLGRSTTGARNSVGVMNVSGTGVLDIHSGNFVIGDRDSGAGQETAQTSGKLVQTGGTVRVAAGAGLYLSGFDNALAVDGQYDLLGGTLEIGGSDLHARYNNATSGYLFNLGGGAIKVIGSSLTTAVDATLVAAATSTIDTNGFDATWTGAITGSGNLVKAGTGTLNLNGAGTSITGDVTISGGTLKTGAANIFSTTTALVVDDGATFDLGGFDQTVGSLAGAGTVLTGISDLIAGDDNSSTTFSGTITNGGVGWTGAYGTFTKSGSGTLTLTNATIGGGEAYVTGTGAIRIATGSTSIDFLGVGSGAGSDADLLVDGGHLSVGVALAVGYFGGTGTVTQTGGTVTIQANCGDTAHCSALTIGNQNGDGTYDISSGTLEMVGGVNAIGRNTTQPPSTGLLHISGDAVVELRPNTAVDDNSQSYGPGLLVIGNHDNATYGGGDAEDQSSGTIQQDGGTLRIAAGSTLNLAGYGSGTYNLAGGVLEIGGSSLQGVEANNGTGSYAFNIGGGSIKVIGSALTTTVNATLVNATTSIIDTNGFGATFSGVLSGSGALVKSGAGTLTLTGANTYQGGTTLNAGTIAIGNATALGIGGVTFAASGTLQFNAALSVANAISIGSGFVATLDSQAFNSTLSGAISGAGGLVKAGSGEVTLSNAANSYTGGTRVEAGTLRAGVDGAFVDGTAYVVNGGTLDLNDFALAMSRLSGTGGAIDLGSAPLTVDQGVDTTYAGAVGGAGALAKSGSGTLTLTGTSLYSGTTTVSAGGLIVNGSIASAVTVASGGLLGGNGTVGGIIVQSGGTLSPGNSIDTMNVAGPVTFDADSTYVVEIDDQGNSDLTDATGIITINGGTLVVDAGAGYVLDDPYTILRSASPIIATPGFVNVTSDFVFLDLAVDYGVADPNEVQLTVSRSALSFGAIGDTPNQQAVGEGLDSLEPGNPLFDAFVVLTSEAEARDALDQLSGEIHPSLRTALLDDSRFVRDAIIGRLTQAPGTSEAPVSDTPFTAWLKAYGSWGTLDGNDEVAGLDRSIGGVFVGLDRPLDDTWTVGFVGGYAHSEVDVDDRRSRASVDTYQLAAYGGAHFGALGLRFGAGYAWHDIETSRSVAFTGFSEQLDASYGAATAQVFGEAGYRVDVTPMAFEPFAGIAYVNVDSDGFTEDGGAAALDADGSSDDATFTTLGVRLSAHIPFEGGTSASLRGTVAWRHAFGDAPAQTFAFDGGSDFVIEGGPLAEDTVVLEAGIGVDVAPGITAGLSYSGQIGDGLSDHGVNASIGVSF